jgi:PBSX family phage terminase large subunit
MKLTEKQKRFCEEYLVDLNATQAYRRAGYSARKDDTARVEGSKLLTKPNIQKYLQELRAKQAARTGVSADFVVQELYRVAGSDPELKGSDKMKALELLGKHLGMFTEKPEEPQNCLAVYSGIPAALIAPAFQPVLLDLADSGHTEYDFPGGRGSTKSSFIALEIVDQIMRSADIHACAVRKVGNTLRDSCYAKICWAVSALGLENEFVCTVSPMEVTKKSTGQKIYFRGADDPGKLKSITPKFGYLALLWFEEMDQFAGESELRTIKQSIIRGGDAATIFCSFNPPKSANNWANDYVLNPPVSRLVTYSDYRSVPRKWLGQPFIDLAEELKEKNPRAYENEYLGKATGDGANVFDNVECREITNEELAQFDNILNGVDWGWMPDLYAFVRVHYDPARLTLYIWQEYTCNKQSNRETAEKLISLGITAADIVTCDSAEEKSVSDYRSFGINARAAEKGPDSRRYSYKWLQSLVKIVIDPNRCPVSAKEFLHYEYERDKEGNIISGYPDGNDHCIDAVRYATNRIWKRKGQ